MSDPFIGQVQILPYTFAPSGWLFCNGAELSAHQFQGLLAVIGTTYGGDFNLNKFNIPNLRQMAAIGAGQGPGLTSRQIGKPYGSSAVQLSSDHIPQHIHTANLAALASGKTNSPTVTAQCWAGQSSNATTLLFTDTQTSPVTSFSPAMIGVTGAGQSHENRQPQLAMQFCIATVGEYPVPA